MRNLSVMNVRKIINYKLKNQILFVYQYAILGNIIHLNKNNAYNNQFAQLIIIL